jgi:hypothetical protein
MIQCIREPAAHVIHDIRNGVPLPKAAQHAFKVRNWNLRYSLWIVSLDYSASSNQVL